LWIVDISQFIVTRIAPAVKRSSLTAEAASAPTDESRTANIGAIGRLAGTGANNDASASRYF
jgi:hypothetical protein